MTAARPRPPTDAGATHAPPRRGLVARAIYTCSSLLVRNLALLFYRLRVTGLENVPKTGPLLVVANHQSHLDPPLIGVSFRHRNLYFMARGGLFRNRFFAWLIRNLNSIPVGEGAGEAAAIRTAIGVLRSGRALLIFPEGTRSPDGGLQPFKRGTWLLISRAQCPVLPVAIEGAFDAWPRWQRLPSLFGHRVSIAMGRVIQPGPLLEMGDQAALAAIAREIEALRRGLPRRRSGAR
ncbi:MAG TPA: lysophospholipid acyltransferase family protein [Phycisphaerales bacterium]|nr:lysophospholipid acyltransferase family protein [Phycisphaerales bacterium]